MMHGMRATVLGVAAVLLAAGCGGSGRLSRADYASRADAICSKYNREIRNLSRPQSISGLPGFVDRALPLAKKGNDELRRLRPPKSEEETAKELVAQNDSIFAAMKRLRDAAKKGNRDGIRTALRDATTANRTAKRLASDLGLRVCAQG
jgi:hypothetical protein